MNYLLLFLFFLAVRCEDVPFDQLHMHCQVNMHSDVDCPSFMTNVIRNIENKSKFVNPFDRYKVDLTTNYEVKTSREIFWMFRQLISPYSISMRCIPQQKGSFIIGRSNSKNIEIYDNKANFCNIALLIEGTKVYGEEPIHCHYYMKSIAEGVQWCPK